MVGGARGAGDRRARILDAALTDFLRAGYAGARMERIARMAGVNKQLPFHYFGSKERLFHVCLARVLDGLTPVIPGTAATAAERLRVYLDSLATSARRQPGLIAILAYSASDTGQPRGIATLVSSWRESVVRSIGAIVSEGQSSGFFRDDLIPEDVAGAALAASLGSGLCGSAQPGVSIGALYAEHCSWR